MPQGVPLLMRVIASSVTCAAKAGLIIKETMKTGNLNIVDKGLNDLQTEADRSAQRCIVNSLTLKFPKITIIGEEPLDEIKTPMKDDWLISEMDEKVLSNTCPAQYIDVKDEEIVVWVDPLDGTSEYTQGFLDYVTVLIGIAINGIPIAGVIHQPYHNYKTESNEAKIGRTVWGLVGLGAFGYKHTPLEGQSPTNHLVIATTRSHRNVHLDNTLKLLKPSEIIRAGGAGYKGLLVLEGVADAYFFPAPGCKKWDTCAPQAIIESVGGKLTDINGTNYDYDKNVEHNNLTGVLACRSLSLHQWLLEQIPSEVKSALSSQL